LNEIHVVRDAPARNESVRTGTRRQFEGDPSHSVADHDEPAQRRWNRWTRGAGRGTGTWPSEGRRRGRERVLAVRMPLYPDLGSGEASRCSTDRGHHLKSTLFGHFRWPKSSPAAVVRFS